MSTTTVSRAWMPLIFATLASSCGGAPPPDTHQVFREIQVHEATIAHASAEAARCPPQGECPPASRVCEAAEGLCEVAGTIDDADAVARCEQARLRCRRVRR